MNTKTVVFVVNIAILACACDFQFVEQPADKGIALDSIEKKISYAIGFNTARELKRDGYRLDAEALAVAVKHVNDNTQPLLDEEEIQAAMSAFQAQLQEQRQRVLAQQSQENMVRGAAFLAQNGQRNNVVSRESGLQLEVLQEGLGAIPVATDRVVISYRGYFISGEVFDTADALSVDMAALIPAKAEALLEMRTGAKWKLFVPPGLGYGAAGGGGVGPDQTLIYEMELLSIEEIDE